VKVLVLHTLPPADCGNGRRREEFDLNASAEHVASALEHAFVAGVRGDASEIARLVESQRSSAAALFEWMGVAFTGSGSETLALCRRKPLMNAVLAAHGVAVPRAGVLPAIVKPADQDGSAGITIESVCEDAGAVERARARWPGPVVVEEFVEGREFAVALWGRTAPDDVSVGETVFRNALRLNTYGAKWEVDSAEFADSPMDYTTTVDCSLRESVVAAARGAWHAAGARGYLRVDVRCNAQGIPVVLDVNANPAIAPGVGICRAVEEAGWSWTCFARRLVEWAYDR
jgi:D-alanine-D-alanine ligase